MKTLQKAANTLPAAVRFCFPPDFVMTACLALQSRILFQKMTEFKYVEGLKVGTRLSQDQIRESWRGSQDVKRHRKHEHEMLVVCPTITVCSSCSSS